MPSRKGQSKKSSGAAVPRARRSRSSVREAHYRSPQSEPAGPPTQHGTLSPRELYQREKERRAARPTPDSPDLLEEARREFRALLAAEASAGKGGRPRKNPQVVARTRTPAPPLELAPDEELPEAVELDEAEPGGKPEDVEE